MGKAGVRIKRIQIKRSMPLRPDQRAYNSVAYWVAKKGK
jgi:hypothetical protein